MSAKKQDISVSDTFKQWVDEHDQQLAQIARESGIDRTLLSKLYHGRARRLNWANSKRLAKITGLTLADLGYL